jgi:hypothetical protein
MGKKIKKPKQGMVFHAPIELTHKNRRFAFWGRTPTNKDRDAWIQRSVNSGYSVLHGKDQIGVFLYRSKTKHKYPQIYYTTMYKKGI